ncbi:MAG: hydrolase [Sphingobacteriales bacterium]|nr:hydrolase [Sphingobacteriales bacterium]
MTSLGLLKRENTALLVVDVQERLMPVIDNSEQVIANVNRLIKGMEVLKVPVIITEQYPKGLGNTSKEVELPANAHIIEKMCFSCMLSAPVTMQVQHLNANSLLLCGVESHICVFKTALDALKLGFEVHVIADAVSSRTADNKGIALERLRQAGAFIVSTEMVMFQLLDEAGTDEFKAISKLIK